MVPALGRPPTRRRTPKPRTTPATSDATPAPPPTRTSATSPRKAPLPEPVTTFANALNKLREPEAFVFPEQVNWLDGLTWMDNFDGFRDVAVAFRADLQRWSRAVILPVDELLLTLGNDLFTEAADLALTHRLAVLLAKLREENPLWRLPELAGELDNIAQNKRRILGFGEDAQGFEPKPGVVTVATMHAAKGLEWDRVYLLGVNTYSFPDGSDQIDTTAANAGTSATISTSSPKPPPNSTNFPWAPWTTTLPATPPSPPAPTSPPSACASST